MEERITIIRDGRPIPFEYCSDTGLYHYNGETSYAGYTLDELYIMDMHGDEYDSEVE